jgi:hypothetical protein
MIELCVWCAMLPIPAELFLKFMLEPAASSNIINLRFLAVVCSPYFDWLPR